MAEEGHPEYQKVTPAATETRAHVWSPPTASLWSRL